MNDGGALLPREAMREKLREHARTMAVVDQGLRLAAHVGADEEETALIVACGLAEALATTKNLLEAHLRTQRRPAYVDRRNVIDGG